MGAEEGEMDTVKLASSMTISLFFILVVWGVVCALGSFLKALAVSKGDQGTPGDLSVLVATAVGLAGLALFARTLPPDVATSLAALALAALALVIGLPMSLVFVVWRMRRTRNSN
jgi:hypothetical protein